MSEFELDFCELTPLPRHGGGRRRSAVMKERFAPCDEFIDHGLLAQICRTVHTAAFCG